MRVLPMSSAVAYIPAYRDQVDHATHSALITLGDLTRLANAAQTPDDAHYVRRRVREVVDAALGAAGVAADKDDSF